MAKKLTKKELAERKLRYAENRKVRLAEKRSEAIKAERKAARAAKKVKKEKPKRKYTRRSATPIDALDNLASVLDPKDNPKTEAKTDHNTEMPGEDSQRPDDDAASLRPRQGHELVPSILCDVANVTRSFNSTFGRCDVKAGDLLAVLFPSGVTAVSATDHRYFSALTNLVSSLAMLVNSGIGDPSSARNVTMNAAALEAEVLSANHSMTFGIL